MAKKNSFTKNVNNSLGGSFNDANQMPNIDLSDTPIGRIGKSAFGLAGSFMGQTKPLYGSGARNNEDGDLSNMMQN
jgi:hypothetical protein